MIETRTLLFTDVVGSTESMVAEGARESERRRRAHFADLREEIERGQGTEVKTMGDGVMASFASATAALQSAIRIQRRVTSRMRPGLAPKIRIGLSSGDVRCEDADCFGLPVVEAARLCAHADGGQILVADATRSLVRETDGLSPCGRIELKGLASPIRVWEADWEVATEALRVVLADDAVLVREGIAQVLEGRGIEVVAQAGDPDELLRQVDELHPDVAIVDVRMPPTYTAEGLEAAKAIRSKSPRTAVLILSQDLEPGYATRMRELGPGGVGYLLKERVADVREFADGVRRVGAGGTAFDPALDTTRQLG